MPVGKRVEVTPKLLQAGVLTAAVADAFAAVPSTGQPSEVTITISRTLADGSTQRLKNRSSEDVDAICDLSADDVFVTAARGSPLEDWYYLGVQGWSARAYIQVEAPHAAEVGAMIDAFLAKTGLMQVVDEPETEEGPSQASAGRTGAEPAASPQPARLRAFLSYRFGAPETEAAAQVVLRFLELLNVEVLTGDSYEPRTLHEKVSERLAGLDLAVVLVGADGESFWTREEISTARAGGAFVIPIVATGATFAPGLFGDLEYIPFAPGHVGDALVSLLEGIAYILRAR